MVESALVFKPGFQLTGWDPPTLGRYNLLYSTDPNVNLIQKHPHRNTQKNVWTNIWAPHGPSQVDKQKNHTCPIRDNQSFNSKPDMLPWLFFTPLFAYELAIVLFDALLVVVVGGYSLFVIPGLICYLKGGQNRETMVQDVQFSHSVMSNSATLWTTAHQTSLPITNSQSLLKLMSVESVELSNHLILCCPHLLPPSIFPSIRIFSNESALCIRWPKFCSFSFNISPSNEYSRLISIRID